MQNALKRSREDSSYNKQLTIGVNGADQTKTPVRSNGSAMINVNGEGGGGEPRKNGATRQLIGPLHWIVEDLPLDENARDHKELISPPAKVTKDLQNRKSDDGDLAKSEYSSLEDGDAEDDDEDFNDETGGNDESLEEDVLDAMTATEILKNGVGDPINGHPGCKVPIKQLQGTFSGCVEGGRQSTMPFSQSLFPNVPLYFSFADHLEAGPTLPPCLTKLMKWKQTPVTPLVVRKVLVNTGFRLLKRKS